MAKMAVGRQLPPREGTALVRTRRSEAGRGAPAAAAGVMAADRLVLSPQAAARAGEKAGGFLSGLWDRAGDLLEDARFWTGIGASWARDWVERKVVVPWKLYRSDEERQLAFTDGAGKAAIRPSA